MFSTRKLPSGRKRKVPAAFTPALLGLIEATANDGAGFLVVEVCASVFRLIARKDPFPLPAYVNLPTMTVSSSSNMPVKIMLSRVPAGVSRHVTVSPLICPITVASSQRPLRRSPSCLSVQFAAAPGMRRSSKSACSSQRALMSARTCTTNGANTQATTTMGFGRSIETSVGRPECYTGRGSLDSPASLLRLCVATRPRPASLDFDLQGKAQECADRDDPRQDAYAAKCGIDGHRVDNVAGDEELEAQQ